MLTLPHHEEIRHFINSWLSSYVDPPCPKSTSESGQWSFRFANREPPRRCRRWRFIGMCSIACTRQVKPIDFVKAPFRSLGCIWCDPSFFTRGTDGKRQCESTLRCTSWYYGYDWLLTHIVELPRFVSRNLFSFWLTSFFSIFFLFLFLYFFYSTLTFNSAKALGSGDALFHVRFTLPVDLMGVPSSLIADHLG